MESIKSTSLSSCLTVLVGLTVSLCLYFFVLIVVFEFSPILMQNSLCVTSLLGGNVTSTSTPHRQFSLEDVGEHCHMESCWLVLSDKVYNLTEFLCTVGRFSIFSQVIVLLSSI